MSDSIASDADAVTTYRAHLTRSGGTRLPCLRVPEDAAVEAGDEIRLVIDGESCHARVESDARGRLLRGAYDNRRLARNPGEGENRLVEWCREHGREADDAVDVDEVDPGYLYGVRVPGERTVYEMTGRPDEGLRDIADSLLGDE
ncbi:DUF7112 family protein [Halorarum halobium]|uniref:DUF7112 family protein n=1 Tax=Halorarum halobium TaxID=3075121 RepID=UPI0028AB8295|nr:hypothetical protein [Halobaculum sp. XH14]